MTIGVTSLALILLPPRRLAYLLGVLVCAALMGWALWLQYGLGLDPCPLCLLQRLAVVAHRHRVPRRRRSTIRAASARAIYAERHDAALAVGRRVRRSADSDCPESRGYSTHSTAGVLATDDAPPRAPIRYAAASADAAFRYLAGAGRPKRDRRVNQRAIISIRAFMVKPKSPKVSWKIGHRDSRARVRSSAGSARFPREFAQSTTMPPIVVPCPPRYLVTEWTTMSAPCSNGRHRYGDASVLSTTSGPPCAWPPARGRRCRGRRAAACRSSRRTPLSWAADGAQRRRGIVPSTNVRRCRTARTWSRAWWRAHMGAVMVMVRTRRQQQGGG